MPEANFTPVPSVPEQYELLLAKLAKAERELEDPESAGRSRHLEEASGIVFDLLYTLDFRHGGELVPRLAALYGYIANELLNVGRTGDRTQLVHLRDMISTLMQSWHSGQHAA
ncbi:MAG TPA: flagellar protein FliS [Gemmatimonadaceae bacterium]|jgi:flagellar biosynthetic protein FliS|nr:flagellar protein FliS [Gemmatimonadaceae bacterium]